MLDLAEIALEAAPGAARGLDHDIEDGGMQHGGPVPVAARERKLFIRPRDSGGGGPPCEAGWWRGRRTRRAARVLVMSGHVRSLASSCNENFWNENEVLRPARRHKSPSPGGGRSPREAWRDGVKARASALRLPASPRTPPRAPAVRDPPPPGQGYRI